MTRLIENVREALVSPLSDGTWHQIEVLHRKVGLEWREDLEPGWGKPKYVEKVLADLDATEVLELARRFIAFTGDDKSVDVENALWTAESDGKKEITELTRLQIAEWLDGHRLCPEGSPVRFVEKFASPVKAAVGDVEYDHHDGLRARPMTFESIWPDGRPPTPEGEVWSHHRLLEGFGFASWPDRRVMHFLETLVHPSVRPAESQYLWVDGLNGVISADGFQLVEDARHAPHSVFRVHRCPPNGCVAGTPKNLIFAANGPKPELGLSDAVNNDVVILKNAEYCLVYGERVSDDGLRWLDLVEWWAREAGTTPDEMSRRQLGVRLMDSLASPAEGRFFSQYFRQLRPVLGDDLPALVPQVYLHYDPITWRELKRRGDAKRFLVQRMDFLMLLPDRVRVVLEIDGKQHYSIREQPCPEKYAETVASDRDLRLAGYDVYRFGGYEVADDARASLTVENFFRRLFQKYRLLS